MTSIKHKIEVLSGPERRRRWSTAEKQSSPTAGVIDSQLVQTTESGGIRGFDAGKKINGRKRHIVVETLGLMVGLVIHSAGIQDRDGAPDVLKTILKRWPWLHLC